MQGKGGTTRIQMGSLTEKDCHTKTSTFPLVIIIGGRQDISAANRLDYRVPLSLCMSSSSHLFFHAVLNLVYNYYHVGYLSMPLEVPLRPGKIN
jgi:hypothetical protein